MQYSFTKIIILFNPNSTGPSETNAKELAKELREKLPKRVSVRTMGTKYAGHAEDIGVRYAKKDTKTLLVSSSGDGGYNELINGVLRYTTKNIAVAVLPSGNANDHFHATVGSDLTERIVAGRTREMDVIEVSATKDGKPWKRYAHSYVGVGLTAYIGEKLTKADLNPRKEKWLVLKYMVKFSHVTLKLDGAKNWQRYSNVIFANIDRMSKMIQLSKKTEIDDGKFEVYTSPAGSTWQLLRHLAVGTAIGLTPIKRTEKMNYIAKSSYKIQLDGEVILIDKGKVLVVTTKKALQSVA